MSQLQIAAAQRRELPDLGRVDRHQVGVVLLDVRVHLLVDALRAEKVVHDVRRRHRHLGQTGLDDTLEEAELVDGDAARAPQLGPGVGRGGAALFALVVAEAEQRALSQAEALDRVDESRRPAAPPELSVGDRGQAGGFLHRDQLADAFVLHRVQRLGRQLAFARLAHRRHQALRPEEAADVLGAESGLPACGHRRIPESSPRDYTASGRKTLRALK
jgi:hypothetical protein